jgi:hypothetical protein
MKYKIAVLDDYQDVALESADWSVIRDRADITVFQDHLNDTDAVIERLRPFDNRRRNNRFQNGAMSAPCC